MALALFPGAGAAFLFAVMVPGALISGWLMRVGIEKPAMAMKPRRRTRQTRLTPAATA